MEALTRAPVLMGAGGFSCASPYIQDVFLHEAPSPLPLLLNTSFDPQEFWLGDRRRMLPQRALRTYRGIFPTSVKRRTGPGDGRASPAIVSHATYLDS